MGAAASAQHDLEVPRTRLEWERLLGGAAIDVQDADAVLVWASRSQADKGEVFRQM